jgi:hypothetical protein
MPHYPPARTLNFALAILASLGLSACVVYDRPYRSGYVHTMPPAGVAYYDYWYYPDVQVYFDTGRQVYFYFSNNRWIEARVLPFALRARLGGYVPIHSRYNQPYIEHHEHSLKYPPHYRDEHRPPERHDERNIPPSRSVPYPHDYNEMPRKEPPNQRTWEQHLENRAPPHAAPNGQAEPRSNVKVPIRQRYEESPRKEPPVKSKDAAHGKAMGKDKADKTAKDAKYKKYKQSGRPADKDPQGDQDKDRRDNR